MGKAIKLLLVVVLTVSMLAACGSSDMPDENGQAEVTKADGGDSGEASEGSDKDMASEEPIVIDILSGTITEGNEGVIEQGIADAYMALHPNITINYIGTTSNELIKKITTLATSGDLPDAFATSGEFAPNAVDLGIVLDLTPYLDQEYLDGFVESALNEVTINGEIVRFPWFSIPAGVIYRTDWLEETGLPIPTTWDEFLEVAQAMTKDTNGDGTTDQWGFSMVGTNNGSGFGRFMMLARTFGVNDATFENGVWRTGVSSPEFAQALKYFTELHTVYGVVPPGPTETGYTEAVNYLATGKTGMMITGSNGMGLVQSQNPDLKDKLGSFSLPKGTRKDGVINIGSYAISSTSEHIEETIDYLKFMVEPENALAFSEGTGRLPTRKESTSSDLFSEPTYKGFVEALDYPFVIEGYPKNAETLNAIGVAYTNIMANGVSFEDALEEILKTNEDLLEKVNN